MKISILLAVVLATTACKKKETHDNTAAVTTEGSATGSAGSAMGSDGSAGSATPSMATNTTTTTETKPATGGLTDPQIAAIVVAANQVDIDAGNLAIKKTKNAEVKKFAELMVKDHTAVLKSASDLVGKLNVKPEENDTSKSVTTAGSDNRAKLEKLDGAEFDKAYVDNEVAYHELVIGVLKDKLIPSATNAELKNTLVSVSPAFDAHLAHAKQVQATLAGGAGSGSAAAGHDHTDKK